MADALVIGWFDSAASTRTDGAAPRRIDVERSPAGTRLTAPGFGATLADGGRARCHVEGDCAAIVIGDPLAGGRAADLATVLESFRRSGPDAFNAGQALAALEGRFALALVDVGRGTITLATDRFAVWPLCFAIDGTRLSFSDRADKVPRTVAPEIDPQAIYNYLHFHVIPATRTVFRGVRRLEAATALTFSASGERSVPTWRPRFANGAAPDGDLAGRFRTLLESAVAREAEGAVGTFLSGGTDSSTIAGMLRKVARRPVPTFSIGFDAEGYDEIGYARIAARHFQTEHHEYYVTPADLCAGIPGVARQYDQPFGNSSAVPAYFCARFAREHGVEKLLAGDGGDELFGGNVRYAKQKVFEVYWSIPSPLRSIVIEPLLANGFAARVPVLKKASSYVTQARVPMPARTETYNLLQRFGAANVIAPVLLDQVDTGEPARLQAEVYARYAHAGFVDRMLAFDWRFTLSDNDLPKVTGTTALAGVQVAFPMLDDAIVDLSLQLPGREKVRGVKLRPFFKQALTGFLPDETIAKKKHGFGLPVGPWLVRDAAFRRLARESLDALAGRGIIRPSLVEDLFSTRLQEHAGYYGEMVWILMMLEQWLQGAAPRYSLR